MRALATCTLLAVGACGSSAGGTADDAGPTDAGGGDASVGTPPDPFYETDTIVDVRLTIAPSDLATLDADPFAEVYVAGTFEALGTIVENVGVRYWPPAWLTRSPIGAR